MAQVAYILTRRRWHLEPPFHASVFIPLTRADLVIVHEPLGVADFPHRLLAAFPGQALDKQHTVQVIRFVLDAAGEQALCFKVHLIAISSKPVTRTNW